jgi:glycosyltransferase involved in cell wall biosynthesis
MNPKSACVSVILPTYNRATFLKEAFDAIKQQILTDWELVIVDDGSTDGTREVVQSLAADIPQVVEYLYQENQGAYGARNTGLDKATGKYIAFYDSDDLWLPHHLSHCVEALEQNDDVDWVYGACRIVDLNTGKILSESTFYRDDTPRDFMKLAVRNWGALRIMHDPNTLECMISSGLYNGLQNSVIRKRVFDNYRFDADSRNEAEDQLSVIRCLKAGYRMAYYDAVHVDYRVHDANSSAAGSSSNLQRQERVLRLLVEGYERILAESNWSPKERSALRRRLSEECFWKLGYATLWVSGQRAEALKIFKKGLRYWPWDWKCWKTYLKCRFLVDILRRR